MSENCLFVSCDIVAHSVAGDLGGMVRRASDINRLVRDSLAAAGPGNAFWFSGGDGGHVAFPRDDAAAVAQDLIVSLRRWSIDNNVPLRIGASTGDVVRIEGADGRVEMIGPGLNLAARLLQRYGSPERVIATDDFARRCAPRTRQGIAMHDRRTVRGPRQEAHEVWLISLADAFSSRWDSSMLSSSLEAEDERHDLSRAVAHRDGLATLYLAKRLLQVNATDPDALKALRGMMGADAHRIGSSQILLQLFSDPFLGQEFVRASVLVERAPGETLCHVNDAGSTMFLILRGRLAGYLPHNDAAGKPDFELGPGELLGEMAFALGARRTATLVSSEDCSLMAFSQSSLYAGTAGTPAQATVKQAVDAIVLGRVLQNTVRTADFLCGSRGTGPLGELDQPWDELRSHSQIITRTWQQGDQHGELRLTDPQFSAPGIYLLVAGRLETSEGDPLSIEPGEPPILVATLGQDVNHRATGLRILEDATILFIRREGFESFGARAYRRFVAAVADRVSARAAVRTSAARRDVPGQMFVEGNVEGLLKVAGDPASRTLDVVFVHGLDGDAKSTWHPKEQPSLFWPAWMAEDVPDIAVWSLGYHVSSSAWRGESMPLADRATNSLAVLESQNLGEKPIVFVCHSLGGLLVKQMLRHALDFGVADWKRIAEQTKGIVFLSTPHSGSDISNWMKHLSTILRLTASVDDLKAHDPRLRELNTWFRNCPTVQSMRVQAYCEKQTVGGLLVVNESSADPGLPGVIPIPVDEDHVTICKPESREKLVYTRVRKFVADATRLA